MSTSLRSAGWSVRPSFAPHGPTEHVTLLADDRGLTQLAGIPDVAWQTPWSEMSDLQLVRSRAGMALLATVAGVRYCWRTRQLDDFETWREIVLERGGAVARRQRRVGVIVLIAVVLLASFGGGIAAFFSGKSTVNRELAGARLVNLTLKDLPSGWTTTTASALGYLFPAASQVITSTTTPSTTTTLSPSATWSRVSGDFQKCMGVTAANDRVYGGAGQMPDYKVSSKIFTSPSLQFLQVASITQYYATTTMVLRDQREMSSPKFGACFVASSASMILSGNSGVTSVAPWSGHRHRPRPAQIYRVAALPSLSSGATGWTRDGCVVAGRLVALACSGVRRAARVEPRRAGPRCRWCGRPAGLDQLLDQVAN